MLCVINAESRTIYITLSNGKHRKINIRSSLHDPSTEAGIKARLDELSNDLNIFCKIQEIPTTKGRVL